MFTLLDRRSPAVRPMISHAGASSWRWGKVGVVLYLSIVAFGCQHEPPTFDQAWSELADPSEHTDADNALDRANLVWRVISEALERDLPIPLGLDSLIEAIIAGDREATTLQTLDDRVSLWRRADYGRVRAQVDLELESRPEAREFPGAVLDSPVGSPESLAQDDLGLAGALVTIRQTVRKFPQESLFLFVPRTPWQVDALALEQRAQSGDTSLAVEALFADGTKRALDGTRLRVAHGVDGFSFAVPGAPPGDAALASALVELAVTYGSGATLRLPPTAGTYRLPLFMGVSEQALMAIESPSFEVVAGAVQAVDLVAPSVVEVNETFALTVRFLDGLGNLASGRRPSSTLWLDDRVVSSFGAGEGSTLRVEGLSLDQPGVSRYRLQTTERLVGWSNPTMVTKQARERLYWGDPGLSGAPTSEAALLEFEQARSLRDFDFAAYTPRLLELSPARAAELARLATEVSLRHRHFVAWSGYRFRGALVLDGLVDAAKLSDVAKREFDRLLPRRLPEGVGSVWNPGRVAIDHSSLSLAMTADGLFAIPEPSDRSSSRKDKRRESEGRGFWGTSSGNVTEPRSPSDAAAGVTSGPVRAPATNLSAVWSEKADRQSILAGLRRGGAFATTGARMIIDCRGLGGGSGRSGTDRTDTEQTDTERTNTNRTNADRTEEGDPVCSVHGTAPLRSLRVVEWDPARHQAQVLAERRPLDRRGRPETQDLLLLRWWRTLNAGTATSDGSSTDREGYGDVDPVPSVSGTMAPHPSDLSGLSGRGLWRGSLTTSDQGLQAAGSQGTVLELTSVGRNQMNFQILGRTATTGLVIEVVDRSHTIAVELEDRLYPDFSPFTFQVLPDQLPFLEETPWGALEGAWIREDPLMDMRWELPELNGQSMGDLIVLVEQVDGHLGVAQFR